MERKIEMLSFEDIPEYTGLEKKSTILTVKEGCIWEGHRSAIWVGRVKDNGDVESGFEKDIENGNTDIFDRARSDLHLLTKHVNLVNRITMGETSAVDYYIPYKVKEHSSTKSTVVEAYVDRSSNVKYDVEYEILLVAEEGFMRYITLGYKTAGSFASVFFDQVKDIESMFEEFFDEKSNDFRITTEGDKEVAFYDDFGEKLFISICSTGELLSMITSIRVIKCERTIM